MIFAHDSDVIRCIFFFSIEKYTKHSNIHCRDILGTETSSGFYLEMTKLQNVKLLNHVKSTQQ